MQRIAWARSQHVTQVFAKVGIAATFVIKVDDIAETDCSKSTHGIKSSCLWSHNDMCVQMCVVSDKEEEICFFR